MPKSLQLNIPTPCHEDWQNMTPNDNGRHCMSCQKTVIDFTTMSDREILDYIGKSNSNICGRVDPGQMDRPLSFPSTGPQLPRKYFWRLLIPTFLIAGKVNAQKGKLRVDTVKVETRDDYPMMGAVAFPAVYKENKISGLVFDSKTNEPIEGVSVIILGAKKMAVAENGSFQFTHIKNNKDITLELSAIGYKTAQQPLLKNANWVDLKIYMDPEPEKLAAVTVVGWDTQKLRGYAGGLIYCYKVTRAQKLMRSLADTLAIPSFRAVKAYPNPVMRGNAINLELAIKEVGDYKLELMDEIGRVVWVQPLQINAKKQTNQVATNAAWSKGIYWLRITGPKTKNVYQAKILLQ